MVYALLPDQTKIYYELTGRGATALLFVHGWLGSSQWWNAQRDYLQNAYTVVQMDLPGHGRSGPFREGWSHAEYAAAIQAVARDIKASQIVLVGHSMSGAYVLEASLDLPQVKALVVVDTLKNLDQLFTLEQAEQGPFQAYRKDFQYAIANIL
jgi:sigma-B regulation protein RsbQ